MIRRFELNPILVIVSGGLLVALVTNLMTGEKTSRSATQHALYSQTISDAEHQAAVLKIFQDRFDELEDKLAAANERVAELEKLLADHGVTVPHE